MSNGDGMYFHDCFGQVKSCNTNMLRLKPVCWLLMGVVLVPWQQTPSHHQSANAVPKMQASILFHACQNSASSHTLLSALGMLMFARSTNACAA
jgi:hypothetical protein